MSLVQEARKSRNGRPKRPLSTFFEAFGILKECFLEMKFLDLDSSSRKPFTDPE